MSTSFLGSPHRTAKSKIPKTNSIADLISKVTIKPDETHVFLEKILYNHVIHEVIFRYLSPLELLRLCRTCRLARTLIQAFMKRTFNINRFLERYFADPVAFRSLQARTGTLVSGSSALQFLARLFYPESDLDLYVQSACDKEVMDWLLQEGYVFVPNAKQPRDLDEAIAVAKEGAFRGEFFMVNPHDEYEDDSIEAVYTFTKQIDRGSSVTKLKVQCIVARQATMHVILSFHSTCVMNVISHNMAYCLYPRATLHDNRTLVCGSELSPGRPEALKKYEGRGYEVVRIKNHTIPSSLASFPHSGSRYMGDSMCWTVPLDTSGIQGRRHYPEKHPVVSHDPIVVASWFLAIGADSIHGAEMAFNVFAHNALYFSYVLDYGVYDDDMARMVVQFSRERRLGDQEFMEKLISSRPQKLIKK
ncbi:hypothetical protein EIP91_010279 [Steccherinum ochraceum]|uniref:F-box domain-containing protein n=1 Tax=Steccherinum ochraceum TaxID=92696 RepID=A0A4R0RZE8_9APHY|nr:hypothetical protein EIP91_010279 [Steccherinum ochraceum]